MVEIGRPKGIRPSAPSHSPHEVGHNKPSARLPVAPHIQTPPPVAEKETQSEFMSLITNMFRRFENGVWPKSQDPHAEPLFPPRFFLNILSR